MDAMDLDNALSRLGVIGNYPPPPGAAAGPPKADPRLHAVCGEFETIMTSLIMKEGLKSAGQAWRDDDEAKDGGYLEMAQDQLAEYLGRQGVLGLADVLYDQMIARRNPSNGGQDNDGN